jgi:hypothetical protein
MKEKELPNWAKHKLKYQTQYNLDNTMTVSVRFNKATDQEYIDYWKALSNKTQFIKKALYICNKTNGFKDISEFLEGYDGNHKDAE